MKAAIDTLMNFSGKRFLVLGDMAELGEQEAALHAEVGGYAAAKGVDQLMAVGDLSINTVRGCSEAGVAARHFDNKQALIDELGSLLTPGTVVLVKGSRSAAMEEVVTAITTGGEQ